MLWMFQRVNYGDVTNAKNKSLPDLMPREWALMVPTIAMAIVMGVVPNVFLRPMEPSVKKTIERVTGRSFANAPAIGDPSTSSGSSRATSRGDRRLAIGRTSQPPTAARQPPTAPTASRQQPTAKAAQQPSANRQAPTAKVPSNE